MKIRHASAAAGFLLAAAFCAPVEGQIVLQTRDLRLEIRPSGTLQSITSNHAGGTEYASTVQPGPIAVIYRGGQLVPASLGKYAASTGRWVYQGGKSFAASRVVLSNDKLTVDFGEGNVTATYRVTATPDYLAFELLSLAGDSIDQIDLLRLKVRPLPYLGSWVNVACDDDFGFCLCAGNIRTNAEMDRHGEHVVMRTTADRDVGFRGATAVLFGCRDPKATFLDAMAIVERDFDMPAGADRRRSPVQRHSYLWASRLTPENVDQYIHLAARGGFRMILFSYTSFAKGAGHFEWKPDYPGGMADLKRVTDAIRKAGLELGIHIHYSKARKNDPYVTPVPDDRLHKVRAFTLAAGVDARADTIVVNENPDGCTRDEGRRLLNVGRELIAYDDCAAEPPFQFTGCRRGHLNTTPASHQKGAPLGLLDVDTWPSFIRFDQQTDIQDETGRRIAEILRQTGPYQMVYFDGAEDVHEPFWYHVASAQHRVFRHLDPPPLVCEAAHYTHFSWHMISRSNAYDVVAPADGMKDFCRLMPCPTAAARAMDFSRIQFGWLGRFGQSGGTYAGPDVWEYVAGRAAAWDCPIALSVSLKDVASNPRADDCLAAIKIWEDARLGNHLTEQQRARLRLVAPEHAEYVSCYRQRGIWENCRTGRDLTDAQRARLSDRREHHLFVNEQGQYEMVDVQEILDVAGGTVKAFAFRRDAQPGDTYVLAWAVDRDVTLRLDLPPDRLTVMRPFASPVPFQSQPAASVISVGNRTYFVMSRTELDQAHQIFRHAKPKTQK